MFADMELIGIPHRVVVANAAWPPARTNTVRAPRPNGKSRPRRTAFAACVVTEPVLKP
jgi:hypothetical protein